jgi:hypothetical protein
MNRAAVTLLFAAVMLTPLLLRRHDRRALFVPAALGALGLAATFLPAARGPTVFTPSRELSEAVADPDSARTPHLRSHLE